MCCVLPMRPCVPHRRMCTTLGRFYRDGDFNRRRGLYIKAVLPKMPGASDPARTSTEGATPTTPPGGVIDRMRHWSIVGSVGPLHGPGRQRSHASAGQPGRTEGEDQLGLTTSHLGPCCRSTSRDQADEPDVLY